MQTAALVTGSSRGIGRAVALELARQGWDLCINYHERADAAAETAQAVRALGRRAITVQADVSDRSAVGAMVERCQAELGEIGVLVNNAGVAPDVRADLLEMSEESFDRVLGINLRGPFFLTQMAAKRIMENKNGAFHCIVNIGSVSADYASINRGEYCLSKAGVAMATKLWAVRLADEGIPVYEIRPGVIKSDMTSVVSAKYDKMIADGLTLQRRWGYPEDIGRAVAALADGSFAYSTGQVVNVDGGLTVERF